MSDYLYNMRINEIEGEIASLKITLKNTADSIRAKEIEEEIEQLEEQLKQLKNNFKRRDFSNFRKEYEIKTNKSSLHNINNNDNSTKCSDEYLGPTGPGDYTEDDKEI